MRTRSINEFSFEHSQPQARTGTTPGAAMAIDGALTADLLVGAGANDVINGMGGIDTLEGAGGNDTLDGGADADWLFGGLGDDTYQADNPFDQIIERSGEGRDMIRASTSFALRDNIEDLTLTGDGNFQAIGNAMDNLLVGNAGSNYIDGGLGADGMIGGDGNDYYVVENSFDQVVEVADQGFDTVQSAASFALSANVEALILTGAALQGIGNAGINMLVGNGNANYLDGGVGIDDMFGGAGDDYYVVDNSFEHVIENADEGQDTVQSAVDFELRDNIETLLLTGTAVQGIGNALNNLIVGSGQANFIYGLDGADTLRGGAGDDFYFLVGTDDVIQENAGEGYDTVYVTYNYTWGSIANIESVIFSGLATSVTGDGGDNRIVSNVSAATIAGGGGADTIIGNHGGDTITGGEGNDFLEGGRDADDVRGGDGNDYISGGHWTDLLFGDAGNDTIYGGDGRDTIQGGDDTDLLYGELGGDEIRGGIGNDTIYGGDDGDNLFGDEGADVLDAGNNNDTINGGDGADSINGGAGADQLSGGTGADVFYFHVGELRNDTIQDFNVAEDRIVFVGFGAGAEVVEFLPALWLINYGDNLTESLSFLVGANVADANFIFT